jgi:hypothetical protein
LLSLLGPITVQRAYYYCHRCGGQFPWDTTVGLTPKRLTPGAERAASMAGLLTDSFDEAATKVLPELSGLHLSETTVQRTTEAAGERLGTLLEQGRVLGGPTPWPWYKDAEGRTCAYISVDATGVRQQAKGGGPAEGRMPYVGMVFNPVPELPEGSPHAPPPKAERQARYVAGLYSLDELSEVMRRQGGQVGMDRAERWIGLTDGGNGLEPFVQRSFPRVEVVILDFWHVSDAVGELARAWHPQDEEKAQQQKAAWCHVLKHEGGAALITQLEALPVPERGALREKYNEVLGYLRNHVARMDYPTYLAKGWSIGSGAVESACKTVVGQRLKLAGMRWREPGTDAVCHLRALYKSERSQWHLFWQRKSRVVNNRSTNK